MDLEDKKLKATRKLNGVAKDSNIEIIEDFINEIKDFELNKDVVEIVNALEDILAEREADKKKIKELEEENHLQRKQIMSAYDKGWIPVQKVKDKIERHKFAKKDFEKEYDSKNYKDDGLRARDFYMIVAEDLIIKALEEILEDK